MLRDNFVIAMRGFACASKYSARQFLAELTAAKLCEFKGKPERFSPQRRAFSGHTVNIRVAFTLSVRQGIAKLSEKGKSVVLPFSRNYQNSDFGTRERLF